MRGSDQEELDQSKSPGMDDNPAMTIEFLRARLLAERSVSRAARQKAGELASRVAELEEQLNVVCIQRKKAEKATEGLLEILENHGITDASEPYDSSSDQEREEYSSAHSIVRRNDSDTYSCSELDSTAGAGGSLSWKGRKNSPHSLEKYKRSMRRGCSFASFGSSSSKLRQGKSCRQIRRRELRTVFQDSKSSSKKVDVQKNGIAVSSEVAESSCDAGSENMENRLSETKDQRTSTGGSESSGNNHLGDHREATSGEHNFDSYERDEEMKGALEHQAQLIYRYEAMEKAQREWEEKLKNGSTNPELCDPGNQSDITEERDDCKEPCIPDSGALFSQAHKEKSEVEGVCLLKGQTCVQVEDYQQPLKASTDHLQDQSSSRKLVTSSSMKENAERNLPSCGSSGKKLTNISPEQISGHQNEIYALVPHERPSDLVGVLDALQQAKISLEQKIKRLEIRETTSIVNDMVVAEPSVPAARPWERNEIPVGCAGLFRIPTDFNVETQNKPNPLVKSSGLSLTNYRPDMEVATESGDRFMMETVSRFSGEDRLIGNEFTNVMQTIPPLKPYLSSYLDVTRASSSRHLYPSYTSIPGLIPQMPSTEQVVGHPTERPANRHPAEHFPFTNDRGIANIFRL